MSSGAEGTARAGLTIKVWDPLVRILHWGLASCVIVAFFTHEGPEIIHNSFGYAALAIALVRIVWGFTGGGYARFAGFIASPHATLDYALAVLARREKHYLGHNPLGGWMIVALLVAVLVTSASGWMLDTDAWFGNEAVERVHSSFAWLFVPLVVLHVAGVIFTSFRQKENLVTAMISGRKVTLGKTSEETPETRAVARN